MLTQSELGQRRAAAIKQKAKNTGMEVMQAGKQYALERFAHRMAQVDGVFSSLSLNSYVKGGQMWNWDGAMADRFRPTQDIDLHVLKQWENGLTETIHNELIEIMGKAADIEGDDGVQFTVGKIQKLEHPHQGIPGLRINLSAYYGEKPREGKPRGDFNVQVHLDISIGGQEPKCGLRPVKLKPMFDGMETPTVKMQPWSYQIAEKLHTIAHQGMNNTRLKDYRDLYTVANMMEKGDTFGDIREAVEHTFQQRHTDLPENMPEGLSEQYIEAFSAQWKAKREENGWLSSPEDFAEVVETIKTTFHQYLGVELVDELESEYQLKFA